MIKPKNLFVIQLLLLLSMAKYCLGSFGFLNSATNALGNLVGDSSLTGNVIIAPTYNYVDNRGPPQSQKVSAFEGYTYTQSNQCSGASLIGETTETTCVRDGTIIPCESFHDPGDYALIKCRDGYTVPNVDSISNELQCLESGRWNAPIYECQPVCGRLAKKSTALIVKGIDAKVTDFPWNVAVYKRTLLICGGTIISELVVLSAAHCFTTETQTGIELIPETEFEIVAGKYHRDYESLEEAPLQRFQPKNIKLHQAYFGFSGNYDADIAIITLDKSIIYQSHIGPICLDMNLQTIAEKQPPHPGSMGLVAGYGYTEADGVPSETLKSIELPVVDFRTCRNEAPDNFKPFLTSDKFCAGYNNGTGGVCKGDSGAGLVFPKIINYERVFYLHGIVSNTRSVGGACDMNFYTLFTHVQNYIDLIKEVVKTSKALPKFKQFFRKKELENRTIPYFRLV